MNRNKRMLTCALIASITAISMMQTMPAMAAPRLNTTPVTKETGKTYEAVSGKKIAAMKYLVMDKEANVPNLTFNFTIVPAAIDETIRNGEDEPMGTFLSEGQNRVAIRSGAHAAVSGIPVITPVSFGTYSTGSESVPADETHAGAAISKSLPSATYTEGSEDVLFPTYDAPDTLIETSTRQATQPNDSITLIGDVDVAANKLGEKYSKQAVIVDFSGVTFSEPGVYRWVMTENDPDLADHGITPDTKMKYLDVYVVETEADSEATPGTLLVEGYVLHEDASFQPGYEEAVEPENKAQGFVNRYETENLKITKTVTGNQGSRDQYFKFTVDIANALPNQKFDIDLANADQTTEINPYNPESHTNPEELYADAEGRVTGIFWLQHGQSLEVLGLPLNTSYTVTETNEEYIPSTSFTEGSGEAVPGMSNVVSDTAITADSVIDYTNKKTGVIPTGVMMETAPYFGIAGLGGLGMILTTRRKKNQDK